MARKQSSTIWYQGNTHKEIYFQGHYHDKMYKGSQLIWQKLNDEFEKDMYYRIQDYSIYDGITYFVGYLYNKDDVFQGTYIAKFNTEKMCLDMLHKIEAVSAYNRYLIHACKDGLVLIKYDYYFSKENTENQPYFGIAKYPIKQSSVFEKVGRNSFSEETTVFVPPFVQNGAYNKHQFIVFGKDYYVKQIVVYDSNNYGYSSFVKYSYNGEIIKETPADNTVLEIQSARQWLDYMNAFSIGNRYFTIFSEKDNRSAGIRTVKAISYDSNMSGKKKYSMDSGDTYVYQDLKQTSTGSDMERAVKRYFAVCNGNLYAAGKINTGDYVPKVIKTIFQLSKESLSVGVQMQENVEIDTVDTIGTKLITHVSSGNLRCFYLIENGEIKGQYNSGRTSDAYAYDNEGNIYMWFGVYRYIFDKNLSFTKIEQEKIRIIK